MPISNWRCCHNVIKRLAWTIRLSLAIIDHDMDGETRSVASLAFWWESFLTALQFHWKLPIWHVRFENESLFIDEGLDAGSSSLHMVMNALDQLQSQGRKVILISYSGNGNGFLTGFRCSRWVLVQVGLK